MHTMRALLLAFTFLMSVLPMIRASTTAQSDVPAAATTLTGVSYANTTFIRTTSSAAAPSSAGATTEAIPISTAYSTTTIGLPNGLLTTSTAYELAPTPTPSFTSTTTVAPSVLNSGGGAMVGPEVGYGMGCYVLLLAIGALL